MVARDIGEYSPAPSRSQALGLRIQEVEGKLTYSASPTYSGSRGSSFPSKDGVLVRLASGKITVTDGPFAESKEVIGGWAILKTDSKAAAVRIATEFMELHRNYWPGFDGESEVRPMFEPGAGP
jgi:hypothetical protein